MSDYVLNGASLELYSEAAKARADLSALLRGLALLESDSGPLPSLRLNIDPWEQPIIGGNSDVQVTLGELAHGFYGTADHDLAAYFDSLSRAIPADQALDDTSVDAILRLEPESPAPGYEETLPSVQAAGTDAIMCAAMDFTLVGLLSRDLWRFDAMGFVSASKTYVFDHMAAPAHAEAIRRRRMADLHSGLTRGSFWSLRGQVFPHLLFGLDVKGQVDKFSARLMRLMFIRFAKLDSTVKAWSTSVNPKFPDGPPEIKRETVATMARYGNDRIFRGHDGTLRTFEHHLWVDKSHRIHVYLDQKGRTVEIGYVGRHLPTMEYPT